MTRKEIRKRVSNAAMDTAFEVGPLPHDIEDMPVFVSRWIGLIRQRDPLLAAISDPEIARTIRG
jgi:hypothetical protein